MTAQSLSELVPLAGAVAIGAMLATAALIALLRPLLVAYALARPNARSSHREPTPQGGGIAVVAAALCALWIAVAITPSLLPDTGRQFTMLTIAAVVLAVTGALDDIRSLPALPRLALQAVAVAAVLAALPPDWHVANFVPTWLERILIGIGFVWFVNLVNFMDGIDWMTVAEAVPITATIGLLAYFGFVAPLAGLLALALLGALLGFAPFNKPVARLFLGDVGSLPIGLLLGWLLLQLAGRGNLAAAFLLPLYYLADATLTLLRRATAGERVWQAHRSHFYQRAGDGGFSVTEIVARVLAVNVALAALALVIVAIPGAAVAIVCLTTGAALVAGLLYQFARGKK